MKGPEINEFSDVVYLCCVIAWGILLSIPVLMYGGYVTGIMWENFVYPLAPTILVPQLSVAHALGLLLICMMPFRRILMDLRRFLTDQEDPIEVYTFSGVTTSAVTSALILCYFQALAAAFKYFM
ncbi:hypothetical protein PP740_gp032 [Stenotrophomonas phage Philippe]|uniref:Membrane protein n=1 Tax=Stenotrophomonas phage Philippe TaxID=2859655 RepID=A0AAE8BJL2_9CAUD|nr:hypothetical protein PP740_gp032 [Stenotrophomonas phage Philippe]QYW02231.1 putative membrane protein [Stenotrophomonas phage Philippe]